MQRLLDAPKSSVNTSSDQRNESELPKAYLDPVQKEVEKVEVTVQENPRIPIPEHVEPELEKRGFWSQFFKQYG